MSYPSQLLSGNLNTTEPLPPGFTTPEPINEPLSMSAFKPSENASMLTERRVKVDPDVAYESGLCTRCEPTKSSPWESGVLMWAQMWFGFLFAIIIILMLVAIYLSAQYISKNGRNNCLPKNRRRCA